MFAQDKIFSQIYLQELSYWDEGLSLEQYNANNAIEGIQELPRPRGRANVHRIAVRDIQDLGERGLKIIHNIGTQLVGKMDGCTGCGKCVKECPEHALSIAEDRTLTVETKHCLGTACYRCQMSCPQKVYQYNQLKLVG